MAKVEDITIDQGSFFQHPFQVFNADGSFLDLTNYSLRGQLRNNFADATESASFTMQIQNATQGTGVGQLGSTTTAALPAPMKGVYDFEILTGSVVTRILEGAATVRPEVTK